MTKTGEAYNLYAKYYLSVLDKIGKDFAKNVDNPKLVLAKYDLDSHQIIRAQEWAYQIGLENLSDSNLCMEFCIKGVLLTNFRQNPSARIKYLELALEYAKSKDLIEQSIFLQNLLGIAYQDAGDLNKSVKIYEGGLTSLDKIKDNAINLAAAGVYMGNLGGIYTRLGDYVKAEDFFRSALDISRNIGDREDELIDICNLGSVLLERGKITDAIECYQLANTIADEISNIGAKGAILLNLGQAYGQIGDPQCLYCLLEAKKIMETYLPDHPDLPTVLHNIANVYDDNQDYAQAMNYLQQALNLCKKTEDIYSQSLIFTSLGSLYLKMEMYENALQCHLSGLEISQKNGYKKHMSICLGNLGNVYYKTERYAEAISSYEQAITLNPIGNQWNLHIWLSNLAKVYRKQEDIEKTVNYLMEAINIVSNLGLLTTKVEYLVDVCNILLEKNEYVSALPHLSNLLASIPQDNFLLKYSTLNQIIRVNTILENIADTIEYREQAYEIAIKELGKADAIYQLGELGNAYNYLGLCFDALNCYSKLLSLEPDQNTKALTMANIGSTQYSLQEYQAAKHSYQSALEIFDSLNNVEQSAEVQKYLHHLDEML